MTEDYGYFAALRNPYDEKFRAVLLHGIHTLGVVGAARIFSDETNAEVNYKFLIDDFFAGAIDDISFECTFNVDINYGTVLSPPTIQLQNMRKIGKETSSSSLLIVNPGPADPELAELIADIETLHAEIIEKASAAISDKYTPQKKERLKDLKRRISSLMERRFIQDKESLFEEYTSILNEFQG